MRAASSVAFAPQAPRVQAAVIGAGVVGLVVARALAKRGVETLILESEDTWDGHHIANSEVIHAWHLLCSRLSQSALVRRWPTVALRLLQKPRRRAQAVWQIARSDA